MTITELMQLKLRLSKEKRMIDRKISIINNLINTAHFIENYKSRRKETEKHWRIKHEVESQRQRKEKADKENCCEKMA